LHSLSSGEVLCTQKIATVPASYARGLPVPLATRGSCWTACFAFGATRVALSFSARFRESPITGSRGRELGGEGRRGGAESAEAGRRAAGSGRLLLGSPAKALCLKVPCLCPLVLCERPTLNRSGSISGIFTLRASGWEPRERTAFKGAAGAASPAAVARGERVSTNVKSCSQRAML